MLEVTDSARSLANQYIKAGIIPPTFATDALHIAIATVQNMDMIVSLNFRHIVRAKTKLATSPISVKNGYRPVEIFEPKEIVG